MVQRSLYKANSADGGNRLCTVRSAGSVYAPERAQNAKPAPAAACKQQNRLAAPKSDFLSTCPDIKPPLNGIMGMCHLAMRDYSDPAGYLYKIDQSSHQLIFAYQRYFGYVQNQTGQGGSPRGASRYSCDLWGCITNIGALAREKNIALRVRIDDLEGQLGGESDELLLNQILTNLLGNAVKFTRKGASSLCVPPRSRSRTGRPYTF